MNKYLDFKGLEVYDSKLKEYINRKIDEVINISLFGTLGNNLIGQGPNAVPIWAENSGFRLCKTEGSIDVKSVSSENWKIENGGLFAIKFLYPHTSSEEAKLSINNIVAPLIWEDGYSVTSDNTWAEEETIIVCYYDNKWLILKKSPKIIEEEKAMVKLSPYPVGSIYMSLDKDANPRELFGGDWEKLDEGRVLISTKQNKYEVGNTGGYEDAVVVEHTHAINVVSGSTTGTYNAYPPMTSNQGVVVNVDYSSGGVPVIENTGVDGKSKNMQPYLVVNMWKRIS